VFTLNPHSADSLDYFDQALPPAAPNARNWLGTDSQGPRHAGPADLRLSRQRLVCAGADRGGHGHRRAAGALQGYFGGKVDLLLQRLIEIWGACPSCTC
jgi:microcin C transport system permease protein